MPDRSRSPLVLALFAALAAIVGGFFWLAPPNLFKAIVALGGQLQGDWRFPVDGAMGLLTLLVMWFGAAGIGHWMLYRFGAVARLRCFWARWALAPMCGWIPLSLAILAAGLAGFCAREAMGGVMAVAAALGLRGWSIFAADVRAWTQEGSHDARAALRLPPWMLTLLAAIYLVAVPYAMTPSVESDELRYHLAAPAQWIQEGRIHYLRHQAFSNFPFQIEMLYTMAMALQGEEGAKLVHLSFLESSAILVALAAHLLITLTLRRLDGERRDAAHNISAFAGGAFAVIPSATLLACWAFIDIAMSAYFFAVVYLGALAIAERRAPPSWLLGLMAAGAMGTKYSMLPLLAAMFALLVVLAAASRGRGRRKNEALKYLFRAAGIAAIVASPWFAKNVMWTGNPVYPLAWGIFGGGEWSAENAAFYAAKAAEKGLHPPQLYRLLAERGIDAPFLLGPAGRAAELLATPLTTSLVPSAFENHILGPIPLMAMALGAAGFLFARSRKAAMPRPVALLTRRRAAILWIGGVIAGSWLFWFLTYQSNRFLLPTLGLVIAAGGWGMMMLWSGELSPWLRRCFLATAAAAFVYSWATTATEVFGERAEQAPMRVALGFESREEYLARNVAYYPAARWLNERTGPGRGNGALLIGEHRLMHFDPGVLGSDWFDTPQPVPYMAFGKDNDLMLDFLAKSGFRYILFNRGEIARYADWYLKPGSLLPPAQAKQRVAMGLPKPRLTEEQWLLMEALLGPVGERPTRGSRLGPDPRLKLVYEDKRSGVMIYELPPIGAIFPRKQ